MATKFEDKSAKSAEAAYAAASSTTGTPAAPVSGNNVAADKAVTAPATAKTEAPKAVPAAAAPVAPKTAPAKPAVAKAAAPAAPKASAPKKTAVKKAAAPKAKTTKTAARKSAPKAAAAKTIKTTKVASAKPAANQEGIKKMANTVKNFAEEAQAKAEEFFGDYNSKAKAAAEKGQELAKDAVEFTKGNVEAVVEAGKIGLKGSQDLTRDYVEFAKQSFEDTTAALKKVAGVKTPTEFFQLQGELSRNAFDAAVKQTSKNSEAVLKLANDMFQPISNRVAVAVSKFKSAA